MGFANKFDFTAQREIKAVPGPLYDNHTINSISYQSVKNHPSTTSGFYNKYDKW